MLWSKPLFYMPLWITTVAIAVAATLALVRGDDAGCRDSVVVSQLVADQQRATCATGATSSWAYKWNGSVEYVIVQCSCHLWAPDAGAPDGVRERGPDDAGTDRSSDAP